MSHLKILLNLDYNFKLKNQGGIIKVCHTCQLLIMVSNRKALMKMW